MSLVSFLILKSLKDSKGSVQDQEPEKEKGSLKRIAKKVSAAILRLGTQNKWKEQ
jgi:hypothetical protein